MRLVANCAIILAGTMFCAASVTKPPTQEQILVWIDQYKGYTHLDTWDIEVTFVDLPNLTYARSWWWPAERRGLLEFDLEEMSQALEPHRVVIHELMHGCVSPLARSLANEISYEVVSVLFERWVAEFTYSAVWPKPL